MNSNNLNLLFVISGMTMGGAERVMATLANEMVLRGHNVTILTFHETLPAYHLRSEVKLISMESGINTSLKSKNSKFRIMKSAISSMKFYLAQVKREKPDLILSFLSKTNLICILGKKIKYRNIPVIVSERADPTQRTGLIQKCVERYYKYSDVVVCQSKKVEMFFKKYNANTTVIPNPVNEHCINTDLIRKRTNKIIAAGRLDKQKNYDLLIDSFFEVSKKLSDYTLEIYGKGPEKERLKQKISNLGLDGKVVLKGTRENLMKNVADAKLYVMSSDFEGFPNALVEAMASGIPVISTDFPTGVAKELIKDGENGYVVPVGDKELLTEAIIKILSNKDIQDEMSKKNVNLREVLNIKCIANQWEQLFNKVSQTK